MEYNVEKYGEKKVFSEQCQQFMKDKQIGDDYGYALALEYLMTEKFYEGIPQYFSKISKEEWIESAKSYLAEPHKGGGK